ncbi:MAG: ethanolamine utilization protein EutJ [Coprothermobacterota bacterium]|nr:ethanolamine utilization protein EutJ [Coprothermobacterota bacterium]
MSAPIKQAGAFESPSAGVEHSVRLRLSQAAGLIRSKGAKGSGPFRVGVDLGTSAVKVIVLDGLGEPAAAILRLATVVRDGVVLDYIGAIDILRQLVRELEKRLGQDLVRCATGIPPGTGSANSRATAHICEAAGLEVTGVIDEPTAAATTLHIREGVVVDVGGGTTGISILHDGLPIQVADEATGGTHFTLVLAGRFGIPFEDAERLKLDTKQSSRLFPVLVPVMEKVASIVARNIDGYRTDRVYLVGGAASLAGFSGVLADRLGLPVVVPPEPMLITPMGLALNVPGGTGDGN